MPETSVSVSESARMLDSEESVTALLVSMWDRERQSVYVCVVNVGERGRHIPDMTALILYCLNNHFVCVCWYTPEYNKNSNTAVCVKTPL